MHKKKNSADNFELCELKKKSLISEIMLCTFTNNAVCSFGSNVILFLPHTTFCKVKLKVLKINWSIKVITTSGQLKLINAVSWSKGLNWIHAQLHFCTFGEEDFMAIWKLGLTMHDAFKMDFKNMFGVMAFINLWPNIKKKIYRNTIYRPWLL